MCEIAALLKNGEPVVMGILNTTPDSFSDGGQYAQVDRAVERALAMVGEGAQIIDVGGESTRPGAEAVTVEDEIKRILPVIQGIRAQSDACISIDTSKPEVMTIAVEAGANLVNDVNGLRAEGALEACAALDVPVCLMHMQGEPRTMQKNPVYGNVVQDIRDFLASRAEACLEAGIKSSNIILDPGFGFGKTLSHNLQLLDQLDVLQSLGYPMLVGLSRKSMLGVILGDVPPDQRLYGSLAAAVLAWTRGARVFRVHDVKPTVDALRVCQAMASVEGGKMA